MVAVAVAEVTVAVAIVEIAVAVAVAVAAVTVVAVAIVALAVVTRVAVAVFVVVVAMVAVITLGTKHVGARVASGKGELQAGLPSVRRIRGVRVEKKTSRVPLLCLALALFRFRTPLSASLTRRRG